MASKVVKMVGTVEANRAVTLSVPAGWAHTWAFDGAWDGQDSLYGSATLDGQAFGATFTRAEGTPGC